MNRKLVLVPFAMLLALICGCASTTTYYVEDQAFADRNEAEIAHRNLLSRTLLDIPRTESPTGGSALVVLPTRDFIEKNGVLMTSGSRKQLSEDDVQYIVGYMDRQFEFAFKTIEQRGIFDDVVLERSDSPESRELGARDYLIYMNLPDSGTDVGTWYVTGQDWTSPQIVPAAVNAVGPAQNALGWLDNLESLVLSERE